MKSANNESVDKIETKKHAEQLSLTIKRFQNTLIYRKDSRNTFFVNISTFFISISEFIGSKDMFNLRVYQLDMTQTVKKYLMRN